MAIAPPVAVRKEEHAAAPECPRMVLASTVPGNPHEAIDMDEEALNISIRKFLKMVGVSSQREIEHAVSAALADGTLKGSETLPAKMTLEIGALRLSVAFDGEIKLQS